MGPARLGRGWLSYAKVRSLTRVATAENEAELAALARSVPASGLGCALAAWRNRHHSGAEIDAYHRQHRSLRWRADLDGMITFTIRLPPHLAATLIALLTTIIWKTKPARNHDKTWPSLAQQHADALAVLLNYDHNPAFHHTRRTVTDELELRCAPCHRQRHHPTIT